MLTVMVDEHVWADLQRYSRADTSVERGGILFGQHYPDEKGGLTVVRGWVEAEYSEASMASVTFTHETWEYVHAERERRFPTEQIVGWYHTHPNFGIFLSNYDVFIHKTLFDFPGATALVIDPVRDEHGAFTLDAGGELVPCGLRTSAEASAIPWLASAVDSAIATGATTVSAPSRAPTNWAVGIAALFLLASVGLTWRLTASVWKDRLSRLSEETLALESQVAALQVALKAEQGAQGSQDADETKGQDGSPPPADQIASDQPPPEQLVFIFVRPGDSLWRISEDVFGDGSLFRVLAEANGLVEPYWLTPGSQIQVPAREE